MKNQSKLVQTNRFESPIESPVKLDNKTKQYYYNITAIDVDAWKDKRYIDTNYNYENLNAGFFVGRVGPLRKFFEMRKEIDRITTPMIFLEEGFEMTMSGIIWFFDFSILLIGTRPYYKVL